MSRKAYFPREEYLGDASTTAFTFDFLITDKSQLLVELYNDDGERQFSVNGMDIDQLSAVTFDETEGGGTVTFASAPAQDYKVVLLLNPDEPTQDFEFRNKSQFVLRQIEKAFDALMGPIMRLTYLQGRSIRIGNYMADYYEFDPSLPSPEGNGGKIIAINDDEDGVEYGPTVAEVEGWKDDAETAAAAAAASQSAAAASASSASSSASAAASSVSAASSSASAAAASETAAAASAASAAGSAGVSVETTISLSNNQGVATDITGMLLSSSTERAAMIFYRVSRYGGSPVVAEAGILMAVCDHAGAWVLNDLGTGGSDSGVVLTITSAGQFQYTSSDISGSTSSISFKKLFVYQGGV